MMKINKKLGVTIVVFAAVFFYGIFHYYSLPSRVEAISRYLAVQDEQGSPYLYSVKIGGVALATALLKVNKSQEQGIVEAVVDVVPWRAIQWLSGHRAGIRLSSKIKADSGLPISFEQQSFSRIKKGKAGREIQYSHENLTMQRRSYVDDIYPDTRDPLSLLVWSMRQKYADGAFFKSSLNIEDRPWLVILKSSLWDPKKDPAIFKIDALFIETNEAYQLKGRYPCEIYMRSTEHESVPLIIRFDLIKFFLSFDIERHPRLL